MKITMAHGSGGKSSAQLMSDIFGKYFKNQILDRMEDAAVLEVGSAGGGETAGTETGGCESAGTKTAGVTPLEFKGGDIGKLCVCGTVNDLLMMGAVPKYLTCGFILEEGLDVDLLDRLVASMAAQAAEAGVIIVAGDTKVVEGAGGLYINTTGIGMIPEGRDVSSSNAKAGDAVIVSGDLGDHHACILSHRMEIENDIVSDCAALNDVVDALFGAGIHVHTMRDVTRGGLGTVINEIADSSGVRVELDEEAIPVNEEVRGFADILGLDPLYLACEGRLVIFAPQEHAAAIVEKLRAGKYSQNAAIIGTVTAENAGKVIMETEIGTQTVLPQPKGELLPRIC